MNMPSNEEEEVFDRLYDRAFNKRTEKQRLREEYKELVGNYAFYKSEMAYKLAVRTLLPEYLDISLSVLKNIQPEPDQPVELFNGPYTGACMDNVAKYPITYSDGAEPAKQLQMHGIDGNAHCPPQKQSMEYVQIEDHVIITKNIYIRENNYPESQSPENLSIIVKEEKETYGPSHNYLLTIKDIKTRYYVQNMRAKMSVSQHASVKEYLRSMMCASRAVINENKANKMHFSFKKVQDALIVSNDQGKLIGTVKLEPYNVVFYEKYCRIYFTLGSGQYLVIQYPRVAFESSKRKLSGLFYKDLARVYVADVYYSKLFNYIIVQDQNKHSALRINVEGLLFTEPSYFEIYLFKKGFGKMLQFDDNVSQRHGVEMLREYGIYEVLAVE